MSDEPLSILSEIPKPTPPPDMSQVFAEGDPRHLNACVNNSSSPKLMYSEGYRQAAELLVRSIDEGKGYPDFLVYPVCQLYRQHLELKLKEILHYLKDLKHYKQGVPQHHKLQLLWNDCEPLLLKHYLKETEDRAWVKNVRECLRRFEEIDPGAQAFRYDTVDGKNSLEGVQKINLGVLRTYFTWIGDWLDSVSNWLYMHVHPDY